MSAQPHGVPRLRSLLVASERAGIPRYDQPVVDARAVDCLRCGALAIGTDLTPHKFRHSHRVWLDEIGTPAILAHDRFGHSMPGIGGTYAHVSALMREALRARLQERWETTLDERLAIAPTSPVPVLNELLAARLKDLPRSAAI